MRNKPSQQKIYIWNMLGNLAAAAVSVLYLMIVSRLLPASRADQFSLAYAISNLWVVIGLFQVRNFQGTDVKGQYSFDQYFLARLMTLSAMLISIYPYLRLIGVDRPLTVFILLVLYRACDVLSDLFQGLFQQQDRLDIAGQAMTFRYALSVVLFAFLLVLTKDLVWALIGLVLFNLIFVFLVDWRISLKFVTINWQHFFKPSHWQAAWQILRACFPLFLSGFLLVGIFNEPRQAIAAGLAAGSLSQGLQRDYSILFMPVFFMSLCILMVRPMMTQLAHLWFNGKRAQFSRQVFQLLAVLAAGGLLVMLVAYWLGTPVLGWLYGVDLSDQTMTLTILVFAGMLYALAIVLENLLTIFRRQAHLLLVYGLMFVTSKIITQPLVAAFQLVGAALSFLLVMALFVLGSAAIYQISKKNEEKNYRGLS